MSSATCSCLFRFNHFTIAEIHHLLLTFSFVVKVFWVCCIRCVPNMIGNIASTDCVWEISSACACLPLPSCWESLYPDSIWVVTCLNMKHENADVPQLTTLSSNTAEMYIPMQRRAKEGAWQRLGDLLEPKENKWLRSKIYERGNVKGEIKRQVSVWRLFPVFGKIESN